MKKITIFLFLIFIYYGSNAEANCGIDNLHTQQDILNSQQCLEERIIELTSALDGFKETGKILGVKVTELQEDTAKCKIYEAEYKYAPKKDKKNHPSRAMAIDCYNLLEKRAINVQTLLKEVGKSELEIERIDKLIATLKDKNNLLNHSVDELIGGVK